MQVKFIKPHAGNHNFKSLIACGNSGSLISLICCGIFIFFTAEIALVGAADNPACKRINFRFYNKSLNHEPK